MIDVGWTGPQSEGAAGLSRASRDALDVGHDGARRLPLRRWSFRAPLPRPASGPSKVRLARASAFVQLADAEPLQCRRRRKDFAIGMICRVR